MTQSPRAMLDALLAQLAATDEAVSDTDPGPAHLAELWEGELQADLAAPVMQQIRFDQFLRELVAMGTDIALRMGSAAVEYSVGGDNESPEPVPEDDEEHPDDQTTTDTEA